MLSSAAEALKRGECVALVTVVRAQGSTPQRAGAKMLVWADGRTVGTIGGGCYENDAFWKAREAITSGKPSLVHYELNDDFAQENGLICGGRMDVHIDPLLPVAAAAHRRGRACRLAPGESRGRRRLPHSRRRRPREVRERRALSRRRGRRRADPGLAPPRRPSANRLRRRRHARAHARSRRDACACGARSEIPRPDRQPREGRAHLVGAPGRRDAARMPRAVTPRLEIGAVTPAEIAISILASSSPSDGVDTGRLSMKVAGRRNQSLIADPQSGPRPESRVEPSPESQCRQRSSATPPSSR